MQELFSNLGIDGRLLLAQAVNFLLLLWLLNRFVFQKLFAFLEKRRVEIEKGVSLKAKAEHELERVGVLEKQALQNARERADALLSQTRMQAQELEKEAVLEAKSKEEHILKEARSRALRETEELMQNTRNSISAVAFTAAEKVLRKVLTQKDKDRLQKEAFHEFLKSV